MELFTPRLLCIHHILVQLYLYRSIIHLLLLGINEGTVHVSRPQLEIEIKRYIIARGTPHEMKLVALTIEDYQDKRSPHNYGKTASTCHT